MRAAILILLGVFLIVSPAAFAENPQAGQAYHLSKADQDKYNALTPAQRSALLKQANKELQDMQAAEKKALVEQAMTSFQAMSPEEQKNMEINALKQWQSMTPAEQQDLRNNFPDLLKGDLKLDPGS